MNCQNLRFIIGKKTETAAGTEKTAFVSTAVLPTLQP
jgi:hypothetical protein